LATAEVGQVDDESTASDRSSRDANQPKRRFGRATRGDQVVNQQYALAGLNRVAVDLQPVGAILELVVVTEVLGGKLPLFADWHKADIQLVSERGANNKTARFDRRDLVDRLAAIRSAELFDDCLKAIRLFEQCRDVAKQHARLGKIGDGPDLCFDVDVLHHR